MSMDVSSRNGNSQPDGSSSLNQSAEKLIDSSVHGNTRSEPAEQEPDTAPKLKISPSDTRDFISGSDVPGNVNFSSLSPSNTEDVDKEEVNHKQIADAEAAHNLQTVSVEADHMRSGPEVRETSKCTPPRPDNTPLNRESLPSEGYKLELEVDAQNKFANTEGTYDEHHNLNKVGTDTQIELEKSDILTEKLTTFSEHASRNFTESMHSKENKCELEVDAQSQVEESGTKGAAACSENISRNFTQSIHSEEYKHEAEIPQSTLEAFGKKGSPVSANSPSKVSEDEARIFTGKHIETSLDDLKVSSTSKNMVLQNENTVCELNHDTLESPLLIETGSPNHEHLKPTVVNATENASNTEAGEGEISPLVKCDALDLPPKTDTTDAIENSTHEHSKPTVTSASENAINAGVADKEMSSLVEGDALDLLPRTDLSNATLVHLSLPHCDGKNTDLLFPREEAASGSSGQPEMEEEGTHIGSGKKRKPTVESTAVSARVLRSRSKDKPEAPLSSNVAEEVPVVVDKKRKRKRKQMKKTPVSEFSRMRNHLRYLLHRINMEQNLIDAYSSEGWRKQSLEKIKPEKELQKAKSHILRYKLKIRDLFQRLDLSFTEGQIPESLFDSEGEIDSEDIFCAKCGSKDVSLDNDIILCDGSCERGFHQFCLEPPLRKEDIPQGDEGWLCPGCDCKVDCIDLLNDFNGVKLSVLDSWEKVFPEANAAAIGKTLEDGSALPSDDSEDDDYNPDRTEVDVELADQETSSDESDYHSASNGSSGSPAKPGFPTKEHLMGLPSEDSEDDDFDPDAPDDDDHDDDKVKEESSSDFTSDSEDLGAVLQDNTSPGDDQGRSNRVGEELEVGVRVKKQSMKDEISYLLNSNESPISVKRHVERLDYKKLHDETYGNESSDSSDEDFEENVGRKRRKNVSGRISGKGSASAGNESDIKPEDGDQEARRSAKQASKQFDTEYGNKGLASHASSSEAGSGKRHKKLGEAVTKRLFYSFKQNQYPKRPEKENLARDLGLTIVQVSKWFENARWSSRHPATTESDGKSGSSRGQTSLLQAKDKLKNKGQVDTEVVLSNENNIAASPVRNLGAEPSQTVDVVVEPLITKEPSEQKSGALKSRKRKYKKGDQPPSSGEKKIEGNSQVGAPDSQWVRRSSRLLSTSNADV